MQEIISHSTLICPECKHKELLEMPTDACQWYYECTQCKTLLKPLKGDCCVFCSYGDVACPPIQLHGKDQTTGGSCCG